MQKCLCVGVSEPSNKSQVVIRPRAETRVGRGLGDRVTADRGTGTGKYNNKKIIIMYNNVIYDMIK